MKSIDWELPEHLKSGYAPIKLAVEPASLLEEKFTVLKDYLFNDEGRTLKRLVLFLDHGARGQGEGLCDLSRSSWCELGEEGPRLASCSLERHSLNASKCIQTAACA